MRSLRRCGGVLVLLLAQLTAHARGVTPYLPLNLDPEFEREVERVLIIGGKPVMTRPIPAALVIDALPKACAVDPGLCGRVRRGLQKYMHDMGVTFASVDGAVTNGAKVVLPNQHGETAQSAYQVSGAAYYQPTDWLLVNAGGIAYQGRTIATGSVLSLGFDWAQLDIGYRDHWWSPMTDSAMLISTEAPTMPSVTLSNYEPFTRFGWQYEVFLARMSYSDKIQLTNGDFTRGYPKFAGARLSLQPENSGWSLAANRILVFGGGAAGGQSAWDVLQAFFDPTKAQTTGFGTEDVIGKQEASLTSRFIYPGRIPFSLYFEYAGNDTASGNRLSFSKTDLSVGLSFPRLGPFDLTYEFSEWQPTWYVHGFSSVQTGYGDGITNDFLSIGHWFGDQRVFGDAIGGQSNMVRIGYEPPGAGRVELTLRSLVNEPFYGAFAYRNEYMGSLMYSYPWKDYVVGSEVDYGRDVFGAHYTRLQAFLRYGDALSRSDDEAAVAAEYDRPDLAEMHIDLGLVGSKILADITSDTPRTQSGLGFGPHIMVGGRRALSAHQDIGAGIEADDIHGVSLVGARIIDYRYRFSNPIALNLFAGAARYAAATPAYGFYYGAGLQWRDVIPKWDVGIDYRYAAKVDRVRSLPTDPQGGYRVDAYYDVTMGTLYVSRKF
jgi:Capsule assembly protein Wzi